MVRRLVGAVLLAVLMATVMEITIPSICDGLEPGGFWYELLGCGKDSAGGGSGGAG